MKQKEYDIINKDIEKQLLFFLIYLFPNTVAEIQRIKKISSNRTHRTKTYNQRLYF